MKQHLYYIYFMQSKRSSNIHQRQRKQMGLKQVKINQFLFKKSKPQQQSNNRIDHPISSSKRNIRLKLKSEVDKLQSSLENQHDIDSASASMNLKSRDSCQASLLNRKNKQGHGYTNNLTFRILKLSKLKNKYEPYQNSRNINKSMYFEQAHRKRSMLPTFQDQTNKVSIFSRSTKSSNFKINKNESFSHKTNKDTLQIFQNYKLTQRIVFFQQLQQKKDLQRNLMTFGKKLQSSLRTEQSSRYLTSQKQKQKQEENKVCRPWSGHSQKSHHQA